MSPFLKKSIYWFLGFSLGSELVWQAYLYYLRVTASKAVKGKKEKEASEELKSLNARKPPDLWNNVLFFPDPNPEAPRSATSQLVFYLESARMSVQICILLASLPVVESLILKKKQEGLCIQVITDHDTLAEHNYSCAQFKAEGIPVMTKNTGYLMHNKFIIIDDEAVLTGSLNLTRQAIRSNHENLVVSTDPRIVLKYKHQFSILWRECEEAE